MVAASPVSTPDCRYLNRRSSDGCENTRSSNWSEDEALNRSASTLRSLSRGYWLCPPRNRRSRHEYDRTSDCRLLPLFARDSGGYLLSNDPCGNERRARHGTRRGNVLHYQDRTRKLVALLEDRLPTFREKLKAVLHQLQQYLFEYRKIEDRARLVRSFALRLNRNPDWAPGNWDEAATPPEWVRLATPLQLACHADVTQPESEDILREIAATIPAYAEARVERRPFVSWTRSRTKRWWWSSTPRSRKQCVRTSQTPSPVPSGSPPDTGGVSTRHWSAPSGKKSGSFAWCQG